MQVFGAHVQKVEILENSKLAPLNDHCHRDLQISTVGVCFGSPVTVAEREAVAGAHDIYLCALARSQSTFVPIISFVKNVVFPTMFRARFRDCFNFATAY